MACAGSAGRARSGDCSWALRLWRQAYRVLRPSSGDLHPDDYRNQRRAVALDHRHLDDRVIPEPARVLEGLGESMNLRASTTALLTAAMAVLAG